jgi:hypothetical protein
MRTLADSVDDFLPDGAKAFISKVEDRSGCNPRQHERRCALKGADNGYQAVLEMST